MNKHACLLGLGLGGWLATAAMAQPAESSFLQQQRTIDQKLADQRRNQAPLESLIDWQWGGWFEYYDFNFSDGVQGSRAYHRPGLTLWTRLTMDDNAHEIFARMKLNYNYFNNGDEYDRQEDWVGPNLDRLWYEVDLGKAFRLTKPSDPVQAKLRVGKTEVMFGTGYALDIPMDAVIADVRFYDFRVRGLVGRVAGSTPPNIDRSPAVASHQSRRFLGTEVAYEGLQHHRPFVYALWNDDDTDERPQDRTQNYAYDTQYFGMGSRGDIVHNLNYWGEAVLEAGRSYGDGMFSHQDVVRAWGADAGLEYLWDTRFKPRVSAEYMFASGDADRLDSPTNAHGGNRSGHDSSFNGFGYRDTGMAAAPVLSNVHIWRFGGSLMPLEQYQCFRDLEVGTDWFLYAKNQRTGAISDITADRRGGFVGWEMDYYVNWRLSSDLSWTVRWGDFFPGGAYSDDKARSFLFTGVTWSF